MIMNMGEIIKDALRYPFSDWKKIIILGFITLISNLSGLYVVDVFIRSNAIILLLGLIGFLFSVFIFGYVFRIIKSSLNSVDELPKYNEWWWMFKDGVRVYIVHLVYLIPVLLLLFVYSHSFLYAISHPSQLTIFASYLQETIIALLFGSINVFIARAGIWFFVVLLYLLITIPILYMGIANMANNDSKLSAAFNLREIFNKIIRLGLKNLVIWYLAIIIPLSIIYLYPNPNRIINLSLVGYLIIMISVLPYFEMYFFRLVALYYNSE